MTEKEKRIEKMNERARQHRDAIQFFAGWCCGLLSGFAFAFVMFVEYYK